MEGRITAPAELLYKVIKGSVFDTTECIGQKTVAGAGEDFEMVTTFYCKTTFFFI